MKISNKILMSALVIALALGLSGQAVLAASPSTINLGTSSNFVILAKTGISTTGATAIIGDIGVSPAAATYITGFALTLPAASAFSSSALVMGKIYAPGYADPTPANLTTAVSDMQTAYTDGAGRAAGVTELSAGNIGGLTFAPNVYKWSTGVTIPTDITLSGSANDVWIFQIAQNLDVSSAVKIILAGGARANNIFWIVAGQTTIGTTAVFNGNILDQTAIVLNTGATLNGRALAQTAVTLDSNAVTIPTSAAATPATPATPAVPATPASGTNTSATPATPAIPATPASNANTSITSATPSSIQSIRDQISAITANLQSLRTQQAALPNSASAFGQQVKAIVVNLTKGSRGDTVNALQQFLISQGKGSAAQALAQNGATLYFGDLTREALAEFQKSVGITPANGYFGAKTRAYINSLIK